MVRMSKTFWGVLSIVALLLFSGYGTAEAAKAHPDACNQCHRSTANPRSMANVCTPCHSPGGSAEIHGAFSGDAASNVLLSNPTAGSGAGSQTSHFWGGTKTAMPQAGSLDPPLTFYNSRYLISTGLVTCTICHDPHLDMVTRPQLLRASINDDLLCYQCHKPFFADNANALLTHPVGATTNYATHQTANPLKYKAVTTDADGRLSTNIAANSDVRLVNGNISCSSCHGTHGADSSSQSKDGLLMWVVDHWEPNNTLVAGDGKLLRTDGPAIDKSVLCQTCHTYQIHGSASGETLGCLVCHSAHVYTSTGPVNYFVLRKSLTIDSTLTPVADGPGPVALSFDYSATPPVDVTTVWADPLSANGYCEKCHGNLTTMLGSSRTHVEGENCRTCHNHSGATYSFEASGGCDGCHGYPPSTNTAGGTTGYAVNGAKNYSTSGFSKDESVTPHAAHAGGSGNYTFSCSACHLNNSHDTGTFQDVFVGGSYSSLASGDGNMTPTYNGTGSGTCAAVYCHSNGGARTGDSSRTYTAASIPVWTAGSTTGAITTCNVCHDNSASMTNGSASHAAHLALTGVTCKTCHVTTADSATVLAAGAIGGTHVNGTVNVAFDTSSFITVGATPYTAATGTCSVYCHSNGVSFASPDWDVATSGDCGACHQYSLAGVATGTGTPLSATHNKHLYTTYNGVQLACTTCHTNAGSGADHVNGSPSFVASYQTAVCNVCHGAQNGNNIASDPDRQPVWGSSTSVDCSTCHLGIRGTIAGKTPLAKDSVLTAGHNRPAGNYAGVKSAAAGGGSNSAANKVCADCHNLTASAGHLNGVTDDTRLVGGFACNSCHAAYNSHQVANCADCHDPHGTSNWFMVRSTSPLYNGGGAATVVFTARSGAESFDENDGAQVNADDICATCHTSTNQGTPHNNKEGVGIHNGGNNQGTDCFTCHKPHTDPTPFAIGAGTSCNGCHDFPPDTGAHFAGIIEAHSTTAEATIDEDRSDCGKCHTGAELYTYNQAGDRASLVPGQMNHGNGDDAAAKLAARQAVLASAVGYNSANKTCATACHNSTLTDGAWNAALTATLVITMQPRPLLQVTSRMATPSLSVPLVITNTLHRRSIAPPATVSMPPALALSLTSPIRAV